MWEWPHSKNCCPVLGSRHLLSVSSLLLPEVEQRKAQISLGKKMREREAVVFRTRVLIQHHQRPSLKHFSKIIYRKNKRVKEDGGTGAEDYSPCVTWISSSPNLWLLIGTTWLTDLFRWMRESGTEGLRRSWTADLRGLDDSSAQWTNSHLPQKDNNKGQSISRHFSSLLQKLCY